MRSPLATRCAAALFFLAATAGAQSAPPPPTDTSTPDAPGAAFSVRSPSPTLAGTKEFLAAAAIQLQLQLDYGPADRTKDRLRAPELAGVKDSAAFARDVKAGVRRVVELVALERAGGFELYAFGSELTDGARNPNPDLAALAPELKRLADVERVRRRGALGHEVYQLSYTQADRALASLKALGYSTVEFSGGEAETALDHIYKPIEDGDLSRLPLAVKLVDAPKTSLMDPAPPRPSAPGAGMGMYGVPGMGMGYGVPSQTSAVPDIGGTYLHQQTTGEPQQRLLLVYDTGDPDSLARLVNLLHEKIDVPAAQMVIEAQVIEVNQNRLDELTVGLFSSDGSLDVSTRQESAGLSPLVLNADTGARDLVRRFGANLRAVVKSGDAEVLSNPSVLVLDGRQARIQVGQQVPVVKSTATVSGVVSSVDYFPVGIVLNLRPRVSDNGQHVTMQVETIVSAVTHGETATGTDANAKVLYAPVVDNRQVQTFVRVADNTPFIIGGLISKTEQRGRTGVPFLSELPLIGGLFGGRSNESVKKEVIVVITPHVIPRDEPSFSYVIPKDADVFSTFGYQLFRNAYRVRTNDRFDLKFVTESDAVRSLQARAKKLVERVPSLGTREPFASLMRGGVPAEELLVRRMIFEIIARTKYADHIDPERIIFFEQAAPPESSRLVRLANRLSELKDAENTLVLDFEAREQLGPDRPFAQPVAKVTREHLELPEGWIARLQSGHKPGPDGLPDRWVVPLGDTSVGNLKPIDLLRGVLMLKRVIALNRSLPLTLRDFQVGREILFPTETDLAQSNWVLDRETAQYFYEVMLYYPAFEEAFKHRSRVVAEQLTAEEQRLASAPAPAPAPAPEPAPAATPAPAPAPAAPPPPPAPTPDKKKATR